MAQFNEKKQDERLEELHKKEEEQLAEMLSQKYGIEYVDLTKKSIDTDALRLVAEIESRQSEIAAFRKINRKILVAMRAPEREDALQSVKNLVRLGYDVERYIVSRASLEHAWDRYHDLSYATETEAGVLTLSNETIQQMISELKTIDDLREHVGSALARRFRRAPRAGRGKRAHALSAGWRPYRSPHLRQGYLRPHFVAHQAPLRTKAQYKECRAGRTLLDTSK